MEHEPYPPRITPTLSTRPVGLLRDAAAATGRQTVRGAKQVGTGVGRFFVGVGYVFVGAGHFLGAPRLWPIVLVPLALTATALVGLDLATESVVDSLVGWIFHFVDDWPILGHEAVEFVTSICVRLVSYTMVTALTMPLTILFGAAFLPSLTRSVVKRGDGPPVTPPAWHRAAGLCLRQMVLVMLILQAGWLVMLPLMWIPGVNLAVAFTVGLCFNGFMIGLAVLTVPMHHHGIGRLRGQFHFAWRHRAHVLGFGTASLCVLVPPVLSLRLLQHLHRAFALPGLGLYLLTAPAVLTGGVLLFRRIVDERPRPTYAP